jgi:hypothetical protein
MATEAVCLATDFSPWLGFRITIPPEHLLRALEHPDAVQAALELGRLDFFSGLLAAIALILALLSVVGIGFLNWRAHIIAKEEARNLVPDSVRMALSGPDAADLLRSVLVEPGVLAAIQAAIVDAGLGDTPRATVVDTDAQHPEAAADAGA